MHPIWSIISFLSDGTGVLFSSDCSLWGIFIKKMQSWSSCETVCTLVLRDFDQNVNWLQVKCSSKNIGKSHPAAHRISRLWCSNSKNWWDSALAWFSTHRRTLGVLFYRWRTELTSVLIILSFQSTDPVCGRVPISCSPSWPWQALHLHHRYTQSSASELTLCIDKYVLPRAIHKNTTFGLLAGAGNHNKY